MSSDLAMLARSIAISFAFGSLVLVIRPRRDSRKGSSLARLPKTSWSWDMLIRMVKTFFDMGA